MEGPSSSGLLAKKWTPSGSPGPGYRFSTLPVRVLSCHTVPMVGSVKSR